MIRLCLAAVSAVGLMVHAGGAQAADGAEIFADTCQACHQLGGVGAPGLAPPVVSAVLKNAAARLKDYPVMVVVKGLTGSIPLADGGSIAGAMPPQQALTDVEVAVVVNYVFRLNRETVSVKAVDVARIRAVMTGNDELKRKRLDLMK